MINASAEIRECMITLGWHTVREVRGTIKMNFEIAKENGFCLRSDIM